jgi:hypothetical protein
MNCNHIKEISVLIYENESLRIRSKLKEIKVLYNVVPWNFIKFNEIS